jgi:hypothetical protein
MDSDGTLEQKLAAYQDRLREAFEGTEREPLLAQRGMWTEVFLRADAVQEELASLEPGARQAAIDRIRRGMGYTEDEVEHLAAVDAERDERWQRGRAYMEERARLAATFEGDVLEEELRVLRERTFGPTAPTIEREEAGGFFRFERPRVYGRN